MGCSGTGSTSHSSTNTTWGGDWSLGMKCTGSGYIQAYQSKLKVSPGW